MTKPVAVRRRALSAPTVVLVLLCVMYGITYVDRVDVGTAASAIKAELGLSNTELGLVFSAFAYPYALLQVGGGWVSDRFGPRMTLTACGLLWAVATILTGFAGGLVSLFLARVLLGLGEGATFPGATRAMQSWVSREVARLRAGDHPRLRASGQRDHAAARRMADAGADMARLVRRARLRKPGVDRRVGLVLTATIRRGIPASRRRIWRCCRRGVTRTSRACRGDRWSVA